MAQTADTFEQLLDQILKLEPEQQSQLIEVVAARLSRRKRKHSVLELRGLGKEVWQGIDAKEYVARERAAWEE